MRLYYEKFDAADCIFKGVFTMLLDRLEQLPLGRFQYKLLAVTGLGWLFDAGA